MNPEKQTTLVDLKNQLFDKLVSLNAVNGAVNSLAKTFSESAYDLAKRLENNVSQLQDRNGLLEKENKELKDKIDLYENVKPKAK